MKAWIIMMGLLSLGLLATVKGHEVSGCVFLAAGWVVFVLDGSGPRPPKAYA